MEIERNSVEEWKSSPDVIEESEKLSACFDCCICLDTATDPVITMCGHLYCWPCIYKWLQFGGSSSLSQCPVCKAEIYQTSVVPLYGRGQNVSETECVDDKEMIIPPRPPAFSWKHRTDEQQHGTFEYQNTEHPYEEESSTTSSPLFSLDRETPEVVCRPVVEMFGEMVYARIFGNPQSLYAYPNSYNSAGSNNSPRLRRQEIETHKSLNRVSFFLFCCLLLCIFVF